MTTAPGTSVPPQRPDGTFDNPDYAQSFEGMATEAFPEAARLVLAEKPNHEDVEIKPDGIVFLPGVWYRRQLTRAFGAGGWAIKPTSPARQVGNGQEWSGALYCLGRWVSASTGGCESGYMSHADMVESAKTDCLTKCCKDLGMATELWEKTWREAWQNEYAEKYQVTSGKDAGKFRWRLKEKRQPRAANLMGQPLGSSAPDVAQQAGQTLSASAAAGQSNAFPGIPDTGEAAPQETYDAIASEMKRLKLGKKGAETFLAQFEGATRVTALTKVQAEKALETLKGDK